AKPAVQTGTATAIRLRDNRKRSRERVPAQFLRSEFSEGARGFYWKRRDGIGLRARGIETACARQTLTAQLPLCFCVVRLELGVGDWPVSESRSGNRAPSTVFVEVYFVEAPVVRCEMNSASADLPAIDNRGLQLGFFFHRRPKGVRLPV